MNKFQINLPKTAFSMKANLPIKEPEFLKFWEKINLYKELRILEREKKSLFFMMVLLMQMGIFTWEQLSIRF